jgi:hypothetical protein
MPSARVPNQLGQRPIAYCETFCNPGLLPTVVPAELSLPIVHWLVRNRFWLMFSLQPLSAVITSRYKWSLLRSSPGGASQTNLFSWRASHCPKHTRPIFHIQGRKCHAMGHIERRWSSVWAHSLLFDPRPKHRCSCEFLCSTS